MLLTSGTARSLNGASAPQHTKSLSMLYVEMCATAAAGISVVTFKSVFGAQVCIGVAVGITNPPAVTWFTSDLFTLALGFLMLSMGLTLTIQDFRDVSLYCHAFKCYQATKQ